jgi:hypothetical protein
MMPLRVAVRKGHVGIVALLVHNGADPNICDEHGSSALIEAAEYKQIAVMRSLIEAGVDVSAADGKGYTALMAAARFGNLEAVRMLLEANASLDARHVTNSMSALHYAAFGDHLDVVEHLLSIGARPYGIDDGPGTYGAAVACKLYGQHCEMGGFLDEAVSHYGLAGDHYEKAVSYFEQQTAETKKRISNTEVGNFFRHLGGAMAAGAMAAGGGFGMASYRVYDVSHLEKLREFYTDKAIQCRLLATACRDLVDCYAQHTSPEEREDCARTLKDQLDLR